MGLNTVNSLLRPGQRTETTLGATYDVHLRLIGKLVGDFLLVIIELFSLDAFVLSQYTRLTDGQNYDSKVPSNEARCAQKQRGSLKIDTDDDKFTYMETRPP